MTSGVPVRITAHRKALSQEWEEAARACSFATFFQTPLWASAFSTSRKGRMLPDARMIEFSDHTRVVLPLTVSRALGGALKVCWSMPAGTYGGWLSADPLTAAHGGALLDFLRSFSDLAWCENPFDPVLSTIELPDSIEDFTQSIDLTGGYESARTRSDYSHRRAVRRAIENGVTIREASNFEQWISYFSLYNASRVRWREKGLLQSKGYPIRLFEALFEVPVQNRKLWLAYLGDTTIAGTLCFYWNCHAVSWSTAGIAGYFHRFRPNDLLYDHAIRHAAEAGYRWFDCNPSRGLKGVSDFKEHIGARKFRCRYINRQSGFRRCFDGLRRVFR
jgi:hypothetical protein